jgi:hypothetical protein
MSSDREQDDLRPEEAELIEQLRLADLAGAEPRFANNLRAAFLEGFGAQAAANASDRGNSASLGEGGVRTQGEVGETLDTDVSRGSTPAARPETAAEPLSPVQRDEKTDWDPNWETPENLALVERLGAGELCEDEPGVEFREELRRCFLSGQFSKHLRRQKSARSPRLRLLRTVLMAAAAAALVILWPPDRGTGFWSLRLIEGDGLVAIESGPEMEVDADGLTSLAGVHIVAENLEGFGSIDVRSSRFELTLPGELVLELTPGTVFDGSQLSLQEDGKRHLSVTKGEVLVRKSKDSGSRPLVIKTLDAEVEVLGTVLGVLCGEDYTCVCVTDGDVEVRPFEAEHSEAEAGETLLVMRDGEEGVRQMAFPAKLCSNSSPDSHENHHVCQLVDFGKRISLTE